MLVFNMSYLKLEGQHVDAVRLLDVWDENGYVFLQIENVTTGIVDSISWSLEYEGNFWLWTIVSISFIENNRLYK